MTTSTAPKPAKRAAPSPPSVDQSTAMRPPLVSRAMTQWTPDDLDVAEALTACGDLRRAADLCWAMLGDGRVRAGLETRVRGLLRQDITWDKATDDERVTAALEADGDWYAMVSEAALYSLCVWGLLLGVGLAQRVWEMRGDRWIGVLKPYDARHLRWDSDRRLWVVRTRDRDVDILPGDKRWVLYAPSCSGTPDGDERPWMFGAWRALCRPWLGKYLSWGDWQGYNQVHATPFRTADLNETAPLDKPGREDLAEALSEVPAALVPPPGVKQIRLVEATAKTWDTFPASIDAASTEMAIATTGQNSSTEIVEGQDTGATLHGQVRADLIASDEQTLSTCVYALLRDYAEVNFGDASLAPYARWDVTPPADVKARGDAMTSLGNGLLTLVRAVPTGFELETDVEFQRAGFGLRALTAPKPTPATVPPHAAHACPAHRKIERPIESALGAPVFNPDRPMWRFHLDRGPDPAVCNNVCDDHDGKVVRGDSDWWSTHTPPLHPNCKCFVEELDAGDAPATPADELPGTDHVVEGFGAGTTPLDLEAEGHAVALEVHATGMEIPPSTLGRPPRDGGTGRVYNPWSEELARVVPKRSVEVGGAARSPWASGSWPEWDEATEPDRLLAMLIIAALFLLEAVALDELLRRKPPPPGARRILDTEDGRLRSAVATEKP